jgi:hypothetical protein
MTNDDSPGAPPQPGVLTPEQAVLLEMYLQNLDNFFENIKASEKVQVEIETLHLKRILTP